MADNDKYTVTVDVVLSGGKHKGQAFMKAYTSDDLLVNVLRWLNDGHIVTMTQLEVRHDTEISFSDRSHEKTRGKIPG